MKNTDVHKSADANIYIQVQKEIKRKYSVSHASGDKWQVNPAFAVLMLLTVDGQFQSPLISLIMDRDIYTKFGQDWKGELSSSGNSNGLIACLHLTSTPFSYEWK